MLQPEGSEVFFSLSPQQHRVSFVFRNVANLMGKQWKQQIAASLAPREVFPYASCFRSMFMRRNRTHLLAQTSRIYALRRLKTSSSSLTPKITRLHAAEAGEGFLFVPGPWGSALALIWLEQDDGWGEWSDFQFSTFQVPLCLPRKSSHLRFGASLCNLE